MAHSDIQDRLLRPPASPETRILFIARHAPDAPGFQCRSYPGDGGYPAYYHRVWSVLTGLGYPVATASHALAPLEAAARTDLVFSLYNRMPVAHPEIIVASLCAYLGLPCVGAGPNGRALAEDKWFSKLAARAIGIPVSDGEAYDRPEDLVRPPAFPGPYFVKRRFGAASEGITDQSIQDDWAGASRIARSFLEQGVAVLVEGYAPGIDITVPVLGGDPPILLGVVRPGSDRTGGIITEDLKRDDPLGYEMFDAQDQADALASDVTALWRAAGPMDYLRLDYRLDPKTGQRRFLEFNVCCHIGRSGAICLAGRQHGLEQPDILGHVIEYTLARQGGGKR